MCTHSLDVSGLPKRPVGVLEVAVIYWAVAVVQNTTAYYICEQPSSGHINMRLIFANMCLPF